MTPFIQSLERFSKTEGVHIATFYLTEEDMSRLHKLLKAYKAGESVKDKIINNYAVPGGTEA